MKNPSEKSFLMKLYIVIGMSSVIFLGLLYLIVTGGTERIQTIMNANHDHNVAANVSASTVAPVEPAAATAKPQAKATTQPEQTTAPAAPAAPATAYAAPDTSIK